MLTVIIVIVITFIVMLIGFGVDDASDVGAAAIVSALLGTMLGLVILVLISGIVWMSAGDNIYDCKQSNTYSLCEYAIGEEEYYVTSKYNNDTKFSMNVMKGNTPSSIDTDGKVSFVYKDNAEPTVEVKELGLKDGLWLWIIGRVDNREYIITLPSPHYVYNQ